ncbi:prolipoprotein diacylglyceryl transferase, partial [Luminiphilus sp.]|nr:prolipoprotein diacylglyceryl transferase [Luminiphilus sp.]
MIHYPQIDPVALSLGPISIYWYGLTYVGGLIFAWWLGKQRAQLAQSPVSEEQIDDLIFYAALGIVAGGRIGYAL